MGVILRVSIMFDLEPKKGGQIWATVGMILKIACNKKMCVLRWT